MNHASQIGFFLIILVCENGTFTSPRKNTFNQLTVNKEIVQTNIRFVVFNSPKAAVHSTVLIKTLFLKRGCRVILTLGTQILGSFCIREGEKI